MKAGGVNVSSGILGLYRSIQDGLALDETFGQSLTWAVGTKYGMQTQMGAAQVANGAMLALTAAVDAILLGDALGVDIPF